MSKFKVGDKVRRARNFSTRINKYFEGEPFVVVASFASHVVDPEGGNHDCHYLELVTEGPVRTVTRLEPVEGKHGIVQLDVHNGQIVVTISPEDGHQPSGDALRSAAMILSQIAEYRDEVTK